MFDILMRRWKDRLIAALQAPLSTVSPAFITTLALLTGLTAAFFAAAVSVLPSLIAWLFSRLLDGLVARRFNKQSDFGGYFDIICDFAVYAAGPLGLTLANPITLNYLALAVMLSSFYFNSASWMYLAAIIEKRAAHSARSHTPGYQCCPREKVWGEIQDCQIRFPVGVRSARFSLGIADHRILYLHSLCACPAGFKYETGGVQRSIFQQPLVDCGS